MGEWKTLLTAQYLYSDIRAGFIVALIAIPLSLSIAWASEIPPLVGIYTAIIASMVTALFGGTRFGVSGPAAALCILLANITTSYGVAGLLITTIIAGLLQLCCGTFGLGRLNRFIPQPVISAFNAGIGMLIIFNELPRLFGHSQPDSYWSGGSALAHVLTLLNDPTINPSTITTITLWLGTAALVFLCQQVNKKMPAMFVAMICMTSLGLIFHVPTITISNTMSATTIHLTLIWQQVLNLPVAPLLLNGLALFLIASLETLFAANTINREIKNRAYNVNQELVGQGLANIILGSCGGLPATNLIYRSACNVRAGAKTRRASIIHALLLLIGLLSCVPLLLAIPIPVLAGVLLAFAISMIKLQDFLQLWQYARADAFVYIVTLATMLSVNLFVGIQAGIIAACLIIVSRTTKTVLQVSYSQEEKTLRIACKGPLTFLSADDIDKIKEKIQSEKTIDVAIVDLSRINDADISGCQAIVDIYDFCQKQALSFYTVGLPQRYESFFSIAGGQKLLQQNNFLNEMELKKKTAKITAPSPYNKLLHGVKCYYAEMNENQRKLYQHLAVKQEPHTLFITCSDSRIVPSLLTATDPGELFMLRNVGNYVPPYSPDQDHSEGAALTFALINLNIKNIVICGHANCGAMHACKNGIDALPKNLQAWIADIRKHLDLSANTKVDELAKQNVLQQIKNIQTYPFVQDNPQQSGIEIHAWFFDFDKELLYAWDEIKQIFVSIVHDKLKPYTDPAATG